MAIESKMRRGPGAFGQPQAEASAPGIWRAVIAAVVLVAIGVGAWLWWHGSGTSDRSSAPQGGYQAVFLDNGQTYFGSLEWDVPREGYARLSGVYYLDFRQNPQDPAANAGDLKLTKLGGEVHAPRDYMDLNQEHVLYVEDLRDDSKVVQAITEYAASNQ